MHSIPNMPARRPLQFVLVVYAAIAVFLTSLGVLVTIWTYGVERHEQWFWNFLLPVTIYGLFASVSLTSAACSLRRKWGPTLAGASLVIAIPGAAVLVEPAIFLLLRPYSLNFGDVLIAAALLVPAGLNMCGGYCWHVNNSRLRPSKRPK